MSTRITRRDAIARLTAGIVLGGCLDVTAGIPAAGSPRLAARPRTPISPGPTGLRPLGLGTARDGLLSVPAGHRLDAPLPLVLLLHGAGQEGATMMTPHRTEAAALGRDLILLAPDSRFGSWDAIRGRFEEDVAFIDAALALVFGQYAVDPARIAVAGFSDGATYALALGRANGDLFSRVVAYSPGFLIDVDHVGRPPLMITHGTGDTILPIASTSRRIVPELRDQGYDVDYREFEGGHGVSPTLMREAIAWMGT